MVLLVPAGVVLLLVLAADPSDLVLVECRKFMVMIVDLPRECVFPPDCLPLPLLVIPEDKVLSLDLDVLRSVCP